MFPLKSLAVGEFKVISIEDPFNLVDKPFYYNSSQDSVMTHIRGQRAVKVTYTQYSDASYSTILKTKDLSPQNYGWDFFTGLGFNCNTYYEGILYDSSNTVLLKARLHVTGIVNPVCDSSSAGEGTGGKGDGSGNGDCATAICECISQLKDVAQTINSSVTSNGSTLNSILNATNSNGSKIDNVNSSVNQVNSSVNQVNNSVKENGNTLNKILDSTNANGVRLDKILDQIIPTGDIEVPNEIKVPSLESNKPPMPDKPFKDDSTYFKDQGDASSPPPLPPAGEPVKCWKDDKDSDVCEEANTNKRDDVNKKDEVNKRDEVNKKDEVNKRDEVNKKDDVNKRDEVNKKDDVNKRDEVNKKDDVSERDKPNKKDDVSDRIPVGKRDPTTPIDPVDHGLPNWNSP